MARPTIDQARGLGDYATSYQWNMYFSKIPTDVPLFPGSEDVNLRCSSTTLPKVAPTKITYEMRGWKVHVPSAPETNSPITFTMNETCDNLVQRWIFNWRKACCQASDLKGHYKSEIEAGIVLHRLNRQDEPIWQYHLHGCFMEDYDLGDAGSTPDLFKPTMSISFDLCLEADLQ
jgi:hypothetical protein